MPETGCERKIMAKKRIKKNAYIRCRGGSPLLEGIDRAALPHDCSAILELYPDGISKCRYGCLGGGSCAAACHLAAISIQDYGPPVVDKDKCVGCGLCARACPQDLIDVIIREYSIRTKCSSHDTGKTAREACANSCIACGICVKVCPAAAIRVEDGKPVIDTRTCLGCGMCAIKCPRGVIRDERGIMTDK